MKSLISGTVFIFCLKIRAISFRRELGVPLIAFISVRSSFKLISFGDLTTLSTASPASVSCFKIFGKSFSISWAILTNCCAPIVCSLWNFLPARCLCCLAFKFLPPTCKLALLLLVSCIETFLPFSNSGSFLLSFTLNLLSSSLRTFKLSITCKTNFSLSSASSGASLYKFPASSVFSLIPVRCKVISPTSSFNILLAWSSNSSEDIFSKALFHLFSNVFLVPAWRSKSAASKGTNFPAWSGNSFCNALMFDIVPFTLRSTAKFCLPVGVVGKPLWSCWFSGVSKNLSLALRSFDPRNL